VFGHDRTPFLSVQHKALKKMIENNLFLVLSNERRQKWEWLEGGSKQRERKKERDR
jgi:hypothetical protein